MARVITRQLRQLSPGRVLAVSALCALLTACGSPEPGPTGSTVGAKDTSGAVDAGNGEGVLFEPKDSLSGADATGGGDAAVGDVSGNTDAGGAPLCASPGGFGCTCTVNDDCDSNYCVQGPQGQICTKTCLDSCPAGFKCVQGGEAGDLTYLCSPTTTTLCQPCEKDSDCDHFGATKGSSACLPVQDTTGSTVGSFCSAPCGGGVTCPKDFSCQVLELAAGKVEQCVPNPGTTCGCNAWGKSKKAATTCSAHTSAGTCWGVRICTDEGLGLCTAATPTVEACNNVDDNCNGETDEGFAYDDGGVQKTLGKVCGAGSCQGGLVVCKADGTGATCSSTSNGKQETCNFKDDNCDGATDEGLTVTDSTCLLTGVCTASTVKAACNIGQWGCDYSAVPGYEAVSETTCDGADNDCDGLTDESFVYGDGKLSIGAPCDGIGACGKGVVICADTKLGAACSTDPAGTSSEATAEICDNIDNDCDGLVDEGCDDDGDGFCDATMTVVGTPAVCTLTGADCNDNNKSVHPGATEICNDVDDDCNKTVDDGCDDDGDNYCDDGMVVVGTPKICSQGAGDCDDKNKAVSPGATEDCNGIDDDCDTKIDIADTDLSKSAPACAKQKGVCQGSTTPTSLCVKGAWLACTDAEYLAHNQTFLSKLEEPLCDDLDNNCDGVVDEKCDVDGDGFCVSSKTTVGKPKVCPSGGGDCNDSEKAINPDAKEACDAKGVDENCNGKSEEENALLCSAFYFDGDGDGYGKADSTSKCLCKGDVASKFTSALVTDCDDKNKAVNPKAKETCATPYDDNCDKDTNDLGALQCVNYYVDLDDDNYGDDKKPAKCVCLPIPSQSYTTTKGGDCVDANKAINPSKQEDCATAYDDNCNGSTNDVGAAYCTDFYKDADNDTYGAKGSKPVCTCKPNASQKFTALKEGDCDDTNSAIKPGVKDTCATPGVDDNCDGNVDLEDSLACTLYYYDKDGDGYGVGAPRCFCAPEKATKITAKQSGDCDDNTAAVKPGATELCNGVDDDCDKTKDEGASATCGAVSHGSVACVSPSCSITKCTTGYFDIDKSYGNGCECGGDSNWGGLGQSCSNPIIGATLVDTSKQRVTYSGNLMPGEPSQWYRVNTVDGTDVGACDTYDVRIRFASNPNNAFQMDVYRGSCAASAQLCKDETEHRYNVHFYGVASGPGAATGKVSGTYAPTPQPISSGECKCTTATGASGPGIPGYNVCTSQTAYYYVRVHYKAGVSPICSNFTIEFSNGYY